MHSTLFKRSVGLLLCIQIAIGPVGLSIAAAEETPPEEDTIQIQDPVLHWNAIMLQAMSDDSNATYGPAIHNNPGAGSRILGILHAAIFDAVNSITRTHQPYRTLVPVEQGTASVDAAVAYAAHDVLSWLFADQVAVFDAELTNHMAEITDGPEKDLGIVVGTIVANNIIAERTNDGSEIAGDYTSSDQPGFHRKDPLNPEQPFWGPVWGEVTPFVLESASQFRAPAPPALNSEEYADAFNEVKTLGGDGITTPTERSSDQEEIGLYWAYDGPKKLGVPPRMYNKIAAHIATEQENTTEENARMFALMNLAQADAGIAAWESKYYYDMWRPVIGLRESDEGTGPTGIGDNNANTEGDINWTPLGAPASNQSGNNFTPPFPAYPSGHATFGSSTLHTIALFYGNDEIPFTFTSEEMNGITTDNNGNVRPLSPRSFDTLSEAIWENAISRIYLGIHWNFDATSGIDMGNAIAEYTFNNYLQPTESLPSCDNGEEGQSGTGSIVEEGAIPCITANDYDISALITAPVSVERGSSFVATLTAANAGPGDANDASISLALPSGVTLNNVLSGSCTVSGSTVTCTDIDIASGASSSAEIEFSISEEHACPSSIVLTPTVSSSDNGDYYGPNNTGSSVSVTIDCEPENDLSATLTGPGSFDEGNVVSLSLTLANAGPSGAATAFGEIALVTGLSFDPGNSSQECAQDGTVIRCTTGGIAPGNNAIYTVGFTPLSTLPCGVDYTFQASVRSSEEELNPTDNISQEVIVTVHCNNSENGDGGQTIEEIRERIRDEEDDSVNPGASRGSGTNEALTALALLCQRNGMHMTHAFTGSYKVRGNDPLMSVVASDEEVIIDGFTESERSILCGMKKFINQEDIPKRQTEEFRSWITTKIAETLHKTQEEISNALVNETLCH